MKMAKEEQYRRFMLQGGPRRMWQLTVATGAATPLTGKEEAVMSFTSDLSGSSRQSW